MIDKNTEIDENAIVHTTRLHFHYFYNTQCHYVTVTQVAVCEI